jgi:hypothetical protein
MHDFSVESKTSRIVHQAPRDKTLKPGTSHAMK